MQGGPLMHVIAAKAVAFREALAGVPGVRGATWSTTRRRWPGLHGHGFDLVSGGTDNHLLLVDLRSKGELTGKQAEAALERARITCNKNTVPGESARRS
jgi:glycine hydroxymethyltransferase